MSLESNSGIFVLVKRHLNAIRIYSVTTSLKFNSGAFGEVKCQPNSLRMDSVGLNVTRMQFSTVKRDLNSIRVHSAK